MFSTFIGGSGDELSFYRSGHAIDAQGNVYVSGLTSSVDYPTTAGAFRTVRTNATYDGFVTKLSANGQTILASTWYGGTNGENLVDDIAIARKGDVVLTGETDTTAGFPLVNANQTTYQGGLRDGFVAAERDVDDGGLLDLLRRQHRDVARDVAVDAAGTIHVVGTTRSPMFPLVQPVQPRSRAPTTPSSRSSPDRHAPLLVVPRQHAGERGGHGRRGTATGDTVAGGWTAGNTFPRVNPYQNVFQGGFTDGWVARIGPGADLGVIKGANRTTAEQARRSSTRSACRTRALTRRPTSSSSTRCRPRSRCSRARRTRAASARTSATR